MLPRRQRRVPRRSKRHRSSFTRRDYVSEKILDLRPEIAYLVLSIQGKNLRAGRRLVRKERVESLFQPLLWLDGKAHAAFAVSFEPSTSVSAWTQSSSSQPSVRPRSS